MEISARSGRATIVASAQITTFEGEPLELTIWFQPEQSFTVKWSFESDASVDDVAVDLEQDDDVFHILCTNFDGVDGRGTGKPLHLVDAGPYRFWLHFRVFLFGKTEDRTLHYTIYMEEKKKV